MVVKEFQCESPVERSLQNNSKEIVKDFPRSNIPKRKPILVAQHKANDEPMLVKPITEIAIDHHQTEIASNQVDTLPEKLSPIILVPEPTGILEVESESHSIIIEKSDLPDKNLISEISENIILTSDQSNSLDDNDVIIKLFRKENIENPENEENQDKSENTKKAIKSKRCRSISLGGAHLRTVS